MPEMFYPGLRGVIAGETEICRLDRKFQYRGFDVCQLVHGASFLEVAYLLLHDDFPTEDEYVDFAAQLAEEQQLPALVYDVFEQLPMHTSASRAVRTGISLISHFDPEPDTHLLQAGHSQTLRLMAKLPILIGAWHRLRNNLPSLAADQEVSYLGNLYRGIHGESPCVAHERALNIAFTVIAEHEFNPSAYVARIVGSVKSDMYGPILAAWETFAGSEHGGGDERPLSILDAVIEHGGIDAWLKSIGNDQPIPGFDHPVYREEDPRVALLNPVCQELAELAGRTDMEMLARTIQVRIWNERKIAPHVDWPLARLFAYLGFPQDLFRPIFAVARMIGWAAHAYEQCESNIPIRPRARYRGAEDCPFEPTRLRSL